jgi:hypothetical protein
MMRVRIEDYYCEKLREAAPSPGRLLGSHPHWWLDDVYSLVKEGRNSDAIDVLFDAIDDMFLDGEFERCNEALEAVRIELLNPTLIVAVLSVTLAAAEHLPYRETLFERSAERLAVIASEMDMDGLLSGLRGRGEV